MGYQRPANRRRHRGACVCVSVCGSRTGHVAAVFQMHIALVNPARSARDRRRRRRSCWTTDGGSSNTPAGHPLRGSGRTTVECPTLTELANGLLPVCSGGFFNALSKAPLSRDQAPSVRRCPGGRSARKVRRLANGVDVRRLPLTQFPSVTGDRSFVRRRWTQNTSLTSGQQNTQCDV